jgi:hypothetical protein
MHRVGVAPIMNQLLRILLLHAVSNRFRRLAAPAQKGNSNLKALFFTSIKGDNCTAVAFSALKLTAAAMDVPVVHYGMPTLPRATERDVARPEQASQPLAR